MKTTVEALLLDVRPIFARGDAPCGEIDMALARLLPGQILVILAPFEPRPLYPKLARAGYSAHPQALPDGSWRIEFRPDASASQGRVAQESCACSMSLGAASTPAPAEVIGVDARGLEPPQPMMRILEALATLPERAELEARTDRRPIHLYALLEERGFAAESQEASDGGFVTRIRRG